MRIAFFGTPDPAAAVLKQLIDRERDDRRPNDIVLVVTQPDQPAGRGRKSAAPPVKILAGDHSVPVLQPATLKNNQDFLQAFQQADIDLAVVVSYGKIFSEKLLEIPAKGFINLHFSLLPRYRGASPVRTAILNGDKHSGVSIMKIVKKLDAGPVYARREQSIRDDDTTGTLEKRLTRTGGDLLLEVVDQLRENPVTPEDQDAQQATHTKQFQKSDGLIHWHAGPKRIDCHIRAMNPWPGAFTFLYRTNKPPLRLNIWKVKRLSQQAEAAPGRVTFVAGDCLRVACGEGQVELLSVQAAGKKVMATADFLRGNPVQAGDRFESKP